MFRTDQIITGTNLQRKFLELSRILRHEPQALLITQKKGGHLVLVNAEIFEDLVQARFEGQRLEQRSTAIEPQ